MWAGRPIVIAIAVGLLWPSVADAGVTISGFGDGPEEFMQGTVAVSGYGPCSGSDSDGCFATYLHGHIRADDGTCVRDDGNPAVSADLPRDGSTFTAAVDGDPAVRGRNRLCVFVERVYWSGVTAVIAQGSAVAYSRGPVPDGDHYDCSDFPDRASAQAYLDEWPWDPSDLDPNGDGVACNETSFRNRLVLGPNGPLPRADPLRLSAADAGRQVNRVLRRNFRRSFSPRALSRRCRRSTPARVRCRVAWRGRANRYGGRVVIRKAGSREHRYALRVRRVDRMGRERLVARRGSP